MLGDALAREEIEGLVEPFIYENLGREKYQLNDQLSNELLTWNRLDLAFKLFYLDNVDVYPELAKEVYKEDIRSQTLGTFIELGNESGKNCFESYIESFSATYESIKEEGFSRDKTLVPLSSNGAILNGAHRVASAIQLNKIVSTVMTEEVDMVADYQYFLDRGVCTKHLDLVVQKFIEYSKDDIYIAFLWPSGVGHRNEVEKMFSNILYKKEIKLAARGAFNLLVELYKHMDWVGTSEDGFGGVKQKLIECFPELESFQVIFFQSESIEKVQKIKEKIRGVYNIGYSSIHITDTKEEAIRMSQLLCNENGLHFLNYAKPYEFLETYKRLDKFKQFLLRNSIKFNDVIIDGSTTLSLYGLRESADLDFLVLDDSSIVVSNKCFETHDSELKYHGKGKTELIYDSRNYFIFYGLKFITFSQLYSMKTNRNEQKDRNDCLIMKASLNGKSYRKLNAQFKQKLFYTKIRMRHSFDRQVKSTLEWLGLYDCVRSAFRRFKNLK
ncbi:hypothetical protein [Cycloclasticus sp.]|uniref:hypothetical protein n=1 Tax=Cycloclasticus sp. TaxID=2024830 RepID=UPI000C0E428B|nr:hypothetical protein [Cycloclasticus sp.]PHR51630.1 MAG: hypothetical protein COA48_00740 [Cycloclasticus sp.]